MNTDSQPEGTPPNPADDPGTPTLFAVRERALELALIHGHSVTDVTAFDREEAERELTAQPAAGSPEDSRPADQTPRETNTGHQVPNAPSVDENAEGRSLNEQLADKGVARAARDHMIQAAKAAAQDK